MVWVLPAALRACEMPPYAALRSSAAPAGAQRRWRDGRGPRRAARCDRGGQGARTTNTARRDVDTEVGMHRCADFLDDLCTRKMSAACDLRRLHHNVVDEQVFEHVDCSPAILHVNRSLMTSGVAAGRIERPASASAPDVPGAETERSCRAALEVAIAQCLEAPSTCMTQQSRPGEDRARQMPPVRRAPASSCSLTRAPSARTSACGSAAARG